MEHTTAMRRNTVWALAALLVVAPAAALAQDTPPAQPPAASEAPVVDASKLGVSLSRIRRELAQAASEESGGEDPLRLQFRVQVIGTAPPIDFLEGFAVSGPLPYGAPTHQEVLNVLTPQEYRSPVVPIYGLAVAAAQKLWQYNKKRQCEAELEEYRRLVMQGVAIAAPRCAQ